MWNSEMGATIVTVKLGLWNVLTYGSTTYTYIQRCYCKVLKNIKTQANGCSERKISFLLDELHENENLIKKLFYTFSVLSF
jgi:hypothetical protein